MRRSGLFSLLFVIVTPASATAEPRVHDGFQLRLAGGVGWTDDAIALGDQPSTAETGHGAGAALNVLAGGTVGSGVVLGGGITAVRAGGLTLVSGTLDTNGSAASTLVMIGPYVDWYFDPKRGLYLEGFVGGAALRFSASGFRDASPYENARGVGFHVGLGDEWFVSDEWSLGFVGELEAARLSVTTDYGRGVSGVTHQVVAPVLLFAATYH